MKHYSCFSGTPVNEMPIDCVRSMMRDFRRRGFSNEEIAEAVFVERKKVDMIIGMKSKARGNKGMSCRFYNAYEYNN